MKKLALCLVLLLAMVVPTVAHADTPTMWVSFMTPKVEGQTFTVTATIMSSAGAVKGATVVFDVLKDSTVIGTVTAIEKKQGYVGKFNIRDYGVGAYFFKVVSVTCPGYTWDGVRSQCGVQILR